MASTRPTIPRRHQALADVVEEGGPGQIAPPGGPLEYRPHGLQRVPLVGRLLPPEEPPLVRAQETGRLRLLYGRERAPAERPEEPAGQVGEAPHHTTTRSSQPIASPMKERAPGKTTTSRKMATKP